MCLWLNRDNHDPIEDGYLGYLDLVKGKRKSGGMSCTHGLRISEAEVS